MPALRLNRSLSVALIAGLSLGTVTAWAEPGVGTPRAWLNPDQHLQDSLERSRQASGWTEVLTDDAEMERDSLDSAAASAMPCPSPTSLTLPTAEQRWSARDDSRPCVAPASAERGINALHLSPLRAELLAQAKELLGTPYRAGGLSPQGFDCSGFVHYTMRQIGVTLPRSAHDQYLSVERVARTELKPGDLVFFKTARRSQKITHVGIYLGDNRFIHAPSRHKHVTVSTLSQGYWRKHFVTGGRPLPA